MKSKTKIERIKKKLDKITLIDDDYILSNLNKLDLYIEILTKDINKYLRDNNIF